mgnify:FL=1|jgi:hypothetical protein
MFESIYAELEDKSIDIVAMRAVGFAPSLGHYYIPMGSDERRPVSRRDYYTLLTAMDAVEEAIKAKRIARPINQ